MESVADQAQLTAEIHLEVIRSRWPQHAWLASNCYLGSRPEVEETLCEMDTVRLSEVQKRTQNGLWVLEDESRESTRCPKLSNVNHH